MTLNDLKKWTLIFPGDLCSWSTAIKLGMLIQVGEVF